MHVLSVCVKYKQSKIRVRLWLFPQIKGQFFKIMFTLKFAKFTFEKGWGWFPTITSAWLGKERRGEQRGGREEKEEDREG